MAKNKPVYGVTVEQAINPADRVRDVRPLPTKVVDWLRSPQNMGLSLLMLTAISVFFPGGAAWLLVLGLCMAWWGLKRKESAPLKMPEQCGLIDEHEINPGTGEPSRAKGIFHVGNEKKTYKEIWLTNSDCRQHFLVLGTTGAGKTEALIAFAANAMSWGSGLLYCDGKGDVSLFAKISAMARRFGRQDDLLVLNFMNGNQSGGAGGGHLRSNSMNPFATGSSDGLVQMIVSLMDDVGGDGAMWKGRATAMLTGIMYAMCWLRDEGLLDLNVGSIRDHMNLKKIIELSDPKFYPELPTKIRHSIRSYLTSLPGYQEEKREKQAQTTLDQHGYLEMQFTRIFGNLADVYGHIFATPFGEVDMHDVVLNRRILVIMLPALEKAGDEIANLGKVVVASLKGMMGGTLGHKIEGKWQDIVENRPTEAPSPFLVILDEVGYYTVDGMALMAAQARSLGFSMIYASQDLNAMKRLNEKEAQSIIANTNTKIFMRTEDPETAKLAIDLAAKAMRVQATGHERETSELGTKYKENLGVSYDEADRISLIDLKSQIEGEMHILFQEKVVRASSFYPAPQTTVDLNVLNLRANHFIWVPKPNQSDLEAMKRAPEIISKLADPNFTKIIGNKAKEYIDGLEEAASNGDEVAMVGRTFQRMLESRKTPVEAACAAVSDVMRALRGGTSAFATDVRSNFHGSSMTGTMATAGFQQQFEQSGGDASQFGAQTGNTFTTPPAQAAARRPFPASARKTPRVDTTVEHVVEVDNGNIVNTAEKIATNDAILKSLTALHFDGDDMDITAEAIDSNIEEALGAPERDAEPRNKPSEERNRMQSAAEAFDRASGAASGAQDDEDEEDGEGGGEQGGELVSKFLEHLISDD